MIIRGRAPLRLGLAGGGTDVAPYCDEFGGAVLNATIDKYAYAYLDEPTERGQVEFVSPDRQRAGQASPDDIQVLAKDFPLHVGVYRRMVDRYYDGRPLSVRITTQVDAPPGSGLGSSSTVVVAMVAALSEHFRLSMSNYDIARLAWQVEREDLGLAGGWQDHYAASFGGFNFMENDPGAPVIVNPLRIRRQTRSELEASLLLYFGGVSRDSAEVIDRQQANVRARSDTALAAAHSVKSEAHTMKRHLLTGDVAGMAQSLQDGWVAKKQLADGISSADIDQAYKVASEYGMLAGKISGAGGGGFMMMIVDPARRHDVMRGLTDECGGRVSTCHFTDTGVEVWNTGGHGGQRIN